MSDEKTATKTIMLSDGTAVEFRELTVSEWERIDPHEEERPVRRYYRLTPDGEQLARRELAVLADRLRPPGGNS